MKVQVKSLEVHSQFIKIPPQTLTGTSTSLSSPLICARGAAEQQHLLLLAAAAGNCSCSCCCCRRQQQAAAAGSCCCCSAGAFPPPGARWCGSPGHGGVRFNGFRRRRSKVREISSRSKSISFSEFLEKSS